MNGDELFITIIEVLGTIAFAISGIRLAAAKRFDWFGAYVAENVSDHVAGIDFSKEKSDFR